MESLYTKYRPQTFADVVGQGHVVATLERAVLEGRTGHAYLFCGPRGTGKTTMARLLAKALLCEQGSGHLPDGSCEQCRLVAAGEHPDVYELDAASNTGVDNVREEIIGRVDYAPVMGKRKVYIIDEVHMLTTAAFNALLKTLEEPPSHVVFVLCTTDPQKILETILSRVQRFDFHAISNDDVLGRLRYVCDQEGFVYEAEALDLVVRHARGGMRDALTKLEQLATGGGGTISLSAAQELLGEVTSSQLADVSMALAERDVPRLFALVAGFSDAGRDLLQVTSELAGRLRDAYVVTAVGPRPGVVAAQGPELERLADEARAWGSVDRLSRALAVLSEASSEMRLATNQRLVLELAFTRLARPESDVTMDALAERVAVLEHRLAQIEAGGLVAPASTPTTAAWGPGMAAAGAAVGATDGGSGGGVAGGPAAGDAGRPEDEAHADAASAQATAIGGDEAQASPAVVSPRTSSVGREAAAEPASKPADGTAVAPGMARETGDASATAAIAPGAPQAAAHVQPGPQDTAPSERPQQAAPAGHAPQQGPSLATSGTGQRAVPSTAGTTGQAPVARQAAAGAASQSAASQQAATAGAAAPSPAVAEPVTDVVTDPGELQRRWKQVCDDLMAAAPSRGSLLMQSTIVADEGSRLLVSLPKGSGFAVKMLDRADVRALIEPLITRQFGYRRLVLAESSLKGADIARADRMAAARSGAAAPSPMVPAAPAHAGAAPYVATAPQAPLAPAPSAPAPASVPAAPIPAPAPLATGAGSASAADAGMASGNGPSPEEAMRPSTQKADYPLPWEAPPAADEDEAPYDDADIYGSYQDDEAPFDLGFADVPPLGGSYAGQSGPGVGPATGPVPVPDDGSPLPSTAPGGGPASSPDQAMQADAALAAQADRAPMPETAKDAYASATAAAPEAVAAAEGSESMAPPATSNAEETQKAPAESAFAASDPVLEGPAAIPAPAPAPEPTPMPIPEPKDPARTPAPKPSPASPKATPAPKPAPKPVAQDDEEARLMALLTQVFGEGVTLKDPAQSLPTEEAGSPDAATTAE